MDHLAQQRALGDAASLGDGLEPIEVRARDHSGQPGVDCIAISGNGRVVPGSGRSHADPLELEFIRQLRAGEQLGRDATLTLECR